MKYEYLQQIEVPKSNSANVLEGDIYVNYLTTEDYSASGSDNYAHGVFPFSMPIIQNPNLANRFMNGARLTDDTGTAWVDITGSITLAPFANFVPTPPPSSGIYPSYPSVDYDSHINPLSLTRRGNIEFPDMPTPYYDPSTSVVSPENKYKGVPPYGLKTVGTNYLSNGELLAQAQHGYWQLSFVATNSSKYPFEEAQYSGETSSYIDILVWDTSVVPSTTVLINDTMLCNVSSQSMRFTGMVNGRADSVVAVPGNTYKVIARKAATSLGDGGVVTISSVNLLLHLIS